jgi:Excalibur calcium-binding domain
MFRTLVVTAALIGSSVAAAPVMVAAHSPENCAALESFSACIYDTCADAPKCDIAEGDPAYCPRQDRDKDGVACECTDW